jgi:hypothetical protein
MQAYALADIEINYEIERIRAWRFRKVSEYMRRLNKDALFSANACRERYNALQDGTALIPTDMDDDPNRRRMELETYRETREQARNNEQEEKDRKEALERKAKDEARTANAQKAEVVSKKLAKIEEDKAKRLMDRAAAAQVRSQRATENATAKQLRNEQIRKQKQAAEKKSKGKRENKVPVANRNDSLTQIDNKNITADTPDPRRLLSMQDLSNMCANRGLETSSKDKDELLAELQDADSEWSATELKKMCRAKGLNANGTKMQMRYHLALAAAQFCDSYAADPEKADGDMAVDQD